MSVPPAAGSAATGPPAAGPQHPAGHRQTVVAPMIATVVSFTVARGASVRAGQPVAVLESMKMEHVVEAPADAVVAAILARPGDTVAAGDPLVELATGSPSSPTADDGPAAQGSGARPELDEYHARRHLTTDEGRSEVVARRHAAGRRTARENVADLCDPGSFVEYGAFAIAAQRQRRSVDDLIVRTPGDGMVSGIGTVNAGLFGGPAGRAAVLSYDYTVLAGTQGQRNHAKTDRLFDLAERERLPVVLLAEGGGGRPGDTDTGGLAGLDISTFATFARLSGLVPLVGVVSGRCFAGNAALLGCCDVIIATPDANIGMGGPAMIEGGGLGLVAPEEIGPVSVQEPNGVIDVVAPDEPAAVATARHYLGFFQGSTTRWEAPDPAGLRDVVPANRRRVYDTRRVVESLCDVGSTLELRRGFGAGMVTTLGRIEGRPIGLLANNPRHLGGAIDADASDKAARFLQLCDAHDLPVITLCDTPGFMVGPDAERSAQVRHFSRLFVAGAALTVPLVTVVLRKCYGLGAMAMAGGSLRAPLATLSWPTGEFGGMGLEGAVRLGYAKELEAIADPDARQAAFDDMVEAAYARGKAMNAATYFEFDDVIDPVDTRGQLVRVLAAAAPPAPRTGKKRPFVDPW